MQAVGRCGRREGVDAPALARWAGHLSILGLSVALALAGGASRCTGPTEPQAVEGPPEVVAGVVLPTRQTSARGGSGYLVRAAVPRTAVTEEAAVAVATEEVVEAPPAEEEAAEARTYVVQPGDTVRALSRRFGISPETILSANPSLAGNPDLLKLGQEVLILPSSGVLHRVTQGDTLVAIARLYEVDVEAIIGHQPNNLVEPYVLHLGQEVFVPGGKWSRADGAPAGAAQATGRFIWPTTGRITQRSWWGHVAIDLGTATGTPIYAADGGTVVEAGWSGVGYGQYVLIDHGNGYRTLYAHMSTILAHLGQKVAKGQKIGLVGSTGNSTGPHLHFEIYRNGVLQDPLAYLP